MINGELKTDVGAILVDRHSSVAVYYKRKKRSHSWTIRFIERRWSPFP